MTTLRILIVEDDADAREMFVELLGAYGHSVQQAANAALALSALESERFDLALIDVGLPDVDGLELARRIRSRIQLPLRLVALTGYDDERTRAEALGAGFDGYVVKPIQEEQLRQVLKQTSRS